MIDPRSRADARRRIGRRAFAAAAALALAGCDGLKKERNPDNAAAGDVLCQVVTHGYSLADDLRETSGITESRRTPGVYWSHNDSGREANLFAVGSDGRHLGRLRVTGAKNTDWEDIAAGPCPDGGPACLYLADTGNNEQHRKTVSLWVIPEPQPSDDATAPATEYRAKWPDEAMDAEALFVLGDGRVFLVTKGSKHDKVDLVRWPTPLRADSAATLRIVRELAPNPEQVGDRVTGASASPDGRLVAIRTYAGLDFFRTADLLGSGHPFAQFDLDPVAEPQGEGVAMDDHGNLVLTSEGPGKHLPGTISQLRCILPK